MPLPSFRSSRSKVRRRRSHHALKPITVLACAACGADVLPHRTCLKCGQYNGRQVKGGMAAVEKQLSGKGGPGASGKIEKIVAVPAEEPPKVE